MDGVRAALGALVDYAGLFPPAQLSMEEAAAAYRQARRGAHAWMLGRFIVRLSEAAQLQAVIPAGERFAVSLILDTGFAGIAQADNLHAEDATLSIEALEMPMQPAEISRWAQALAGSSLSSLPAYVETDENAMAELAQAGLGAKIRCGGADATAYPSPQRVARFVARACEYGVPFKATAGLHHPVRHFNRSAGVTMHGFLNLLAVTMLARAAQGEEAIVQAASCEAPGRFILDEGGFSFGGVQADPGQLAALRAQSLIAYGSCSFSEPVEDLQAMGILK